MTAKADAVDTSGISTTDVTVVNVTNRQVERIKAVGIIAFEQPARDWGKCGHRRGWYCRAVR